MTYACPTPENVTPNLANLVVNNRPPSRGLVPAAMAMQRLQLTEAQVPNQQSLESLGLRRPPQTIKLLLNSISGHELMDLEQPK